LIYNSGKRVVFFLIQGISNKAYQGNNKMTFLKEFHYTNSFSRRIVYANIFITSAIISFITAELVAIGRYYFLYLPVLKIILTAALFFLLLGAAAARFLFSKISEYRGLYILTDLLMISVVSLFFLRGLLGQEDSEILLRLFNLYPLLLVVMAGIPFLLYGMKLHYLMKISCGDFIDDKQTIHLFNIYLLAGLLAGTALKYLFILYNLELYLFVLIPALLIPLTFFLNLPYSPPVQYAQEYEAEKNDSEVAIPLNKENLILNYVNFSIPAMYIFLIYICIVHAQGNYLYVKAIFFLVLILSCLGGYITGNILKFRVWHNLQVFYPPLFLLPVFVLYRTGNTLSLWLACVLFVPVLFFFSFVLNQNIKKIIIHYRHNERFNIIELSTVLMPIPIIIVLTMVPFTHFWFFFLVYSVCLVNILLPGIFIINKKVGNLVKGFYFAYVLLFISAVVFSHQFFALSMKSDFFITHINNFDALKNVNYNAPYIKSEAVIEMQGMPVFSVKDSTVRNLKRALAPLSLYYSVNDTSKVLFIDGNQRFFRNPCIGYFTRSLCIDPLSDRNTDFSVLPFSGKQTYVPDSDDILFFMRKNRNNFTIITDITNLLDQSCNFFRFSDEYYRMIKSILVKDGIMAQVINIPGCSSEAAVSLFSNLKKNFRYHSVYLFSDVMIILSTDSGTALQIDREKYSNLTNFLAWQQEEQVIFFDEQHVLSHVLFSDMAEVQSYMPEKVPVNYCFPGKRKNLFSPDEKFIDAYLAEDGRFFSLVNSGESGTSFLAMVKNRFDYNAQILSFLKATEFYESRNNYEKETEYLFELKKKMDYRIALKEYLVRVLAYKEVSYIDSAQRCTEEKQWERAKRLYESILWINKDNFDANYRLGILSITLQDIDSAALYLQNAMRLKKDDPKVLYQMGVLEFTKGNITRAIDYFHQAINFKETSSSLYLYLGMSYEELGNVVEAENYYSKALMEDPNDLNIQSRLDNIRQLKNQEIKKWESQERKNQTEEEQDVDIPIPVNKSAYDIRLNDEEEEKK